MVLLSAPGAAHGLPNVAHDSVAKAYPSPDEHPPRRPALQFTGDSLERVGE
jgi:hypothetical protein